MESDPGWHRALAWALALALAGCAGPGDTGSAPTAAGQPRPVPVAAKPPGQAVPKPDLVKPGGPPAKPAVRRGAVTEIDLTTFFGLREAGRAVVYDVRPGLFYRMGHIPGAVAFSGKAFGERFPQEQPALDAAVAAGKVIVLYCTNLDCPDGGVVAAWLADRGYPVSVYKGGWEEWKSAGLPTE